MMLCQKAKPQKRCHTHKRFVAAVILPFLAIVAACFCCGGLLAWTEKNLEITQNDEALIHFYKTKALHWPAAAATATVTSTPELTFEWIKCDKPTGLPDGHTYQDLIEKHYYQLGVNPKSNHDQQVIGCLLSFDFDLRAKINAASSGNSSVDQDTLLDLIDRSTDGKGCKVNIPGGAIYWFTIASTIGCGNTTPNCTLGQALVCIAGCIICIIATRALCGKSADYWVDYFDNWFFLYGHPQLVRGLMSIFFWLSMFLAWALVVMVVMVEFFQLRIGDEFSWRDGWWFSLTTLSTVGFGDFHFAHEKFTYPDLFVVSLDVMVGFSFLDALYKKVNNRLDNPTHAGFHWPRGLEAFVAEE